MIPNESDDDRNFYWIEPDSINESIFNPKDLTLPKIVNMCPSKSVDVAAKTAAIKGPATTTKYKKAPEAPRRFKSAFIFFSIEKHRQIRENLASDGEVESVRFVPALGSVIHKACNILTAIVLYQTCRPQTLPKWCRYIGSCWMWRSGRSGKRRLARIARGTTLRL